MCVTLLSFCSPVQRNRAARRQWQWQSQETCISSATGQPTCPPPGAENTALLRSPECPKGQQITMCMSAEQPGRYADVPTSLLQPGYEADMPTTVKQMDKQKTLGFKDINIILLWIKTINTSIYLL